MAEQGLIPIESGVWVDAYNKITSKGITGTITVQMDPSNQRFVTELRETGIAPIVTRYMRKTVAMRTRSDGEWVVGEKHYDNLEIRDDDVMNALTSVQKCQMVLEIKEIKR